MAQAVYILGTLTTLACGILLLRGYGRGRSKLLLWSAICFFGLALSNALVFADLVIFTRIDLYFWRLLAAALAMAALMYGLIWETE